MQWAAYGNGEHLRGNDCNGGNIYGCPCESCQRLVRFYSLKIKVKVVLPVGFKNYDDYRQFVIEEMELDRDRFVVEFEFEKKGV